MAPKGKKVAAKAVPVPVKAVVPAGTVDNRSLPTKEAGLFKQVLQQYEQKQWRKGIKTADSILKVRPNHGETLAMKGLFLTCTGAKEDGIDLVKKGVSKDMGSHIVWHVYGLVQRAEKNYEEALKCYTQANRIEKDSLNILGDLSILSIHLRHYSLYVTHRLQILRLAPRLRRNWLALAMARFLAAEYKDADRTLRNYEASLREVPEDEYEMSEVTTFHAMVLLESGETDEEALEYLQEHQRVIVDKRAYSEMRANVLLKLGRQEPAEWAWDILLAENPDSYDYISSTVRSKGGDTDSRDPATISKSLSILSDLSSTHPSSLALKRVALKLASGSEFKSRATDYLRNALTKGIPSLWVDIKALYAGSEGKAKRVVVEEIAEGFQEELENEGRFKLGQAECDDEDTIEATSTYLWTLYFLASSYSASTPPPTPSQLAKALSVLQIALTHTPSLPELHTLHARILKRMGDTRGALQAMRDAVELDGQDRGLNSKLGKYALRADQTEEAEKTVGLFTKKDAPSPVQDLIDMQCFWFIAEEGASFVRQKKWNLALKRFWTVFEIFNEIEEDQYDFHTYSIRKATLRAYVNLMRYMDTLRSHPRYYEAAKGAIEIYLRMHDDPTLVTVTPPPAATPHTNGSGVNGTSHAEEPTKVVEEKEKPAEKKVATVDKGKKVAKKGAEKEKEKEKEEEEVIPPVIDQDPLGYKLLETKKPLEEALKFWKPLEKAAPGHIGTWILGFEIAFRREKYAVALKALRNAHSIDPSSPELHPSIVKFVSFLQSNATLTTGPVLETLQAGAKALIGEQSLQAYNSAFLQREDGIEHKLAAAKGLKILGAKEEAVALLLGATAAPEVGYEQLAEAFEFLKSFADLATVEEFRQAAHAKWSKATAFLAPGEMKKEVEILHAVNGSSNKEDLDD